MNQQLKKHQLILTDRGMLSVTGVSDLLSFDEELVTLSISGSTLSVTGQDLCVTKLSLETGEVNVRGSIEALVYSTEETKKTFFSKIFN